MVHVIDTDLVPFSERADYLFSAMEQSPLPLINMSRSRFSDRDFHARFQGKMLGEAFVTRFDANAVQMVRASREISEQSSRMVLLVLLHRGAYEQLFEYDAPSFRTRPGDFMVLDLDAPQSVTFLDSALTTCVYMPRRLLEPFLDRADPLRPFLIRPGDDMYGMLAACFREAISVVHPSAAAGALSVLAHAMLVARGLHPLEVDEIAGSLDAARRKQALDYIAVHCHDPRLDVQKVADHIRISLRTLHLAFEATDTSVAACILAARLALARRMLTRDLQTSTLDVALACGFNSLSTFYRGFSDAYGLPPGQFRRRPGQ